MGSPRGYAGVRGPPDRESGRKWPKTASAGRGRRGGSPRWSPGSRRGSLAPAPPPTLVRKLQHNAPASCQGVSMIGPRPAAARAGEGGRAPGRPWRVLLEPLGSPGWSPPSSPERKSRAERWSRPPAGRQRAVAASEAVRRPRPRAGRGPPVSSWRSRGRGSPPLSLPLLLREPRIGGGLRPSGIQEASLRVGAPSGDVRHPWRCTLSQGRPLAPFLFPALKKSPEGLGDFSQPEYRRTSRRGPGRQPPGESQADHRELRSDTGPPRLPPRSGAPRSPAVHRHQHQHTHPDRMANAGRPWRGPRRPHLGARTVDAARRQRPRKTQVGEEPSARRTLRSLSSAPPRRPPGRARPRRPVSPSGTPTERPKAVPARPASVLGRSIAVAGGVGRKAPPEARFLEPSGLSLLAPGDSNEQLRNGAGQPPLITSFRLGYSVRRDGRPSQCTPPGTRRGPCLPRCHLRTRRRAAGWRGPDTKRVPRWQPPGDGARRTQNPGRNRRPTWLILPVAYACLKD